MKTEPRPSGRTIVLELVREMEDRLYPLFYRVLPPRAYHVYLHPDDYREIETVAPVIAADAQRALTERVDTLNRRPRWQRALLGEQQPIEPPSAGWEIAIHPDANSELERGQLGIVSRLAVAARPTFEGGTPTTRIARTVVTGTLRRTTTSEEATPLIAVAAAPAVPANSTSTAEARVEAPRGFAQLAYVDEQGPHTFVMRKDVVSIGRGGSAHWVDVQITTGPRVSREHCRIRRAGDGRFFLQDLSTWGTSVNGQRVKSYLQTSPAGQIAETGQEHELPRDARIQLADALQIDFQTLDPR
ncbi:MAG TPA: FHA domain-containing protein [Vicinamibacterales bacterium]|nr:FHA domain-containing protein [Vicinamibacterales bacterium]